MFFVFHSGVEGTRIAVRELSQAGQGSSTLLLFLSTVINNFHRG
jgi:hypothetical protein